MLGITCQTIVHSWVFPQCSIATLNSLEALNTYSIMCQTTTGGTFYSQLNGSFLQPSEIFGFLSLRQSSCNMIMESSKMTSPLNSSGLTFFFFFPLRMSLPRRYVASIKRPFSVRFDPYTSSVEVLDNPLKIQGGLESVKDELKMLADALSVLSWWSPSPQWSVSVLLLFGFTPLCSTTCDKTNIFLCCTSSYDAISLESLLVWHWLVGWQGCNQIKPQNAEQNLSF